MSALMGYRIVREVDSTAELAQEISGLLPQLSNSNPSIGLDQLTDLLNSPRTDLFTARSSDDKLAGMLTLITSRVPTGLKSSIEDVVVDSSHRGSGIGQELVKVALERAAELGSKTVDLTSRPDREAANRLYVRSGFSLRDTNVYRYLLTGPSGG